MLIASLTTVIAVGAVFGVIGYRVFKSGESAAPAAGPVAPAEAALPAGAKVLSSAIGEGRLVLTVEVGGAIELLSFDLKSLQPIGRMRLGTPK